MSRVQAEIVLREIALAIRDLLRGGRGVIALPSATRRFDAASMLADVAYSYDTTNALTMEDAAIALERLLAAHPEVRSLIPMTIAKINEMKVPSVWAAEPEGRPADAASRPKIDPLIYGVDETTRFVMSRSMGDVTKKSDPIEWNALADYLDACGLTDEENEARIAAILSGVPFEIDDSRIVIHRVEHTAL